MGNKFYFNLSEFEKIEDIIYFDEPILSHLKLNDKDFLLYLVDSTDDFDILLLFQVDEDVIFQYLTKSKSLKNIIQQCNFVNIISRNFDDVILDTQIAMPISLPKEYFPSEESFLEYNPTESSYYKEKLKEFERTLYLHELRKNSFYLKFSTNDKKFGNTIGLVELTNTMLKNVSQSYKNFAQIDFDKRFFHLTDGERNSIFKQVKSDIDFRMTDLKYGSFEIGLATDKLMKGNIEYKDVRIWADNVGDQFKKIVLDENIDKDELAIILETYSEQERYNIFAPIVKILENPKYELKIRNSKEKKFKSLGLKNKEISSKIVTKNKIKEVQDKVDLEIIQLLTVIDKNSKKININIENSLFDVVGDSKYTITSKDFFKYNYTDIPKDLQIFLDIKKYGDNITLSTTYQNQFFGVDFNDLNKFESVMKEIIDKIYEFIINIE